jgi:hypothetical protein
MYHELFKQNNNVPDELWKTFLCTLVAASIFSEESFIQKLLSLQINLSEIYVPFCIDSDGIVQVKEELKTVNAIRRF